MKHLELSKTLLYFSIVFMFAGSSAAFSFGSVAYDTEKDSDGTSSFEIGLINLNDESLQINFTTRGIDSGEVKRAFVLEPSETATNPTGSGWISTGNGAYAKPYNLEFSASFEQNQNFTARIEASKIQDSSGQRINPLPIQVREHGFTVKTPSEESPVVDRGFEKPSEEEEESSTVDEDIGGEDQSRMTVGESSQDETVNSEREENNSEGPIITIPDTEKTGKNGFDPLTGLLGLAAAGSVAYLWSVL